MKRIILILFLIISLLTTAIMPIFAAEAEKAEPIVSEQPEAEAPAEAEAEAEPAAETEAQPDESSSLPEADLPEADEKTQTRSPDGMTVSAEGLAFIAEFTGSDPQGTKQFSAAVDTVNEFLARKSLMLNQAQFDALTDFVMEKGTDMLCSGYRVERVIAGGSYTDAELAEAFCAWVKDGSGKFSEANLARRLRQIKLFLYGSYTGVCDADFRYVVYDANGGKLDDNTVLCYSYGASFSALPTASSEGFYFAGWYTAASGGSHLYNGAPVNGNYRVYAHWSASYVAEPNAKGSDETPPDNGGGSGTTPGSEGGAGVTTYPDHPEWPALPALKISEAGIQFIKNHEGFAKYPMSDYGQYSVGYGSRYNGNGDPISISSPITQDEADYLLRYYLASFEQAIDKVLEKGTVKHTQAQYDAIISLTYNLGQQWVSSNYQIYQYILFGGCTETDFVNSLGSWCSAGGTMLAGLCMRRMEEADLYFNGDYTLKNSPYRCMIFNATGGKSSDTVEYYRAGNSFGKLPTAEKSGYTFSGWFDRTNGGTQFTESSAVPTAYVTYAYAHWMEGSTPTPIDDPDPIDDPEPQPEGFADVGIADWYYPWVTKAVDAGLFGGVGENRFAPDEAMTRAMLVTVLYRMAGSPKVSGTVNFTDVPADEWYTDAVIWASENGIVNGVGEALFAPDDNITREQIAAILYRYAGSPAVTGTLLDFPDLVKVSDYARDAIQWCFANGIIGGSDGLLLPDGNATRAQCAKMLVVFTELRKS